MSSSLIAGKRQVHDAARMAVLAVIEAKKQELFGNFKGDMSGVEIKRDAWNAVRDKAYEVKLITDDRDYTFVRKSLWGSWKDATMVSFILDFSCFCSCVVEVDVLCVYLQNKVDNAKQTGTAGGKSCVLTEVDNKILDIIGRTSPVIVGLNVS